MEILIYTIVTTSMIYLVVKTLSFDLVVKKPKHGIFGAYIIYSDQGQNKLLVSEKYNLQGKPDYIFKTRLTGKYIPVEIKSTQLKEDEEYPHEGDLMQLVAYFLIIEDVYHRRPKNGRLIYKNRMFIVKNTRKLRRQLKNYLREMRRMLETGKGEAFPDFPKCRNCVCQGTVCQWYERE